MSDMNLDLIMEVKSGEHNHDPPLLLKSETYVMMKDNAPIMGVEIVGASVLGAN